MQREISLRFVPFNTEISKLMVLHGLNPLIDLECKLSTTLLQVMECLKKYISKEGCIDSIIGYKNEIKITPELELIRDNPKTSEGSKSSSKNRSDDGHVLVWSQNSAKGLILKDLYILMNFREPLYLYYYWDEVSSSDRGASSQYYYQTDKSKEKILDRNEYEDFIEMVANVVQNVLVKKKKRRSRVNRKRSLPEANTEHNVKKNIPIPKLPDPQIKETSRNKLAKTSPSSELVYDLDKPFKLLFDRPRPQSVNPHINIKKTFDDTEKQSVPHIVDEPKKPLYELLHQSESEKNSRVFPIVGSAANSMRIVTTQPNNNYSGFPLLDLSEVEEVEKVPREHMELESKKMTESERNHKRTAKQRRTLHEEVKKQSDMKLPHPNEAFKMYPKNKQEKYESGNKEEEISSFW